VRYEIFDAELAQTIGHDAQFVEHNSVVGMLGSETCLRQPLKVLCIDLGGEVVPARVMLLICRDVGRLGRCDRECSERREYKDRDKSDRPAAPSRYHDLIFDVPPENMAKSSL
jgi:hypothetical protein